ncbi:MAG TPA: type II toxin-antitoxin system RelE/ParE family toxin [Stellaceae bacterium]|jgi:toxin ParE1/3/4
MRLRFSRGAERDLEDIADYIAKGNPARALSYVQEMRQHCRHLLAFPESAPLRPELGDGVRMSIFGNYLVLYVVQRDVLEVRRVVHGARNLARGI